VTPGFVGVWHGCVCVAAVVVPPGDVGGAGVVCGVDCVTWSPPVVGTGVVSAVVVGALGMGAVVVTSDVTSGVVVTASVAGGSVVGAGAVASVV
jgi:hypothetical protein